MYRHINIDGILSIKYYTNIPITNFKRFSLPANDNLMRQGDLYKLLYISIRDQGLLDPLLCYDIVNVDLNNPPIYRNRKIYGAYLIRGNIRWLCCKDLGITHLNAIVAEMDHGQTEGTLFTGTSFEYDTVTTLETASDINNCFNGYNPNASIQTNHIDMSVPALTSVESFGVTDKDATLLDYTDTVTASDTDYSGSQKISES